MELSENPFNFNNAAVARETFSTKWKPTLTPGNEHDVILMVSFTLNAFQLQRWRNKFSVKDVQALSEFGFRCRVKRPMCASTKK